MISFSLLESWPIREAGFWILTRRKQWDLGDENTMLYNVSDVTKAQIKGYYLTQIKGQTLDILWVFPSVEIFYHRNFVDTFHGGNPATWWLHHKVGFDFFTTTTFKDLVYGQSSSTGRDYGSPHIVDFFFFTTNHTNLNGSIRWGSPFRPPPWAQSLYSQSSDWGWFLKTYPRVQIFTYSPRTGTRSKCLQNSWGVTLTMEPNHHRRLQDEVGFFFLTTTNKQIPKGTTYTCLIFSRP